MLNFNLFILLTSKHCMRKYKPVEFQFHPELKELQGDLKKSKEIQELP